MTDQNNGTRKITIIKHIPNSDEKIARAQGLLLVQDLTLVENIKSVH